eukprot:1555788-Pleurochrysis_carterae.AAC.1
MCFQGTLLTPCITIAAPAIFNTALLVPSLPACSAPLRSLSQLVITHGFTNAGAVDDAARLYQLDAGACTSKEAAISALLAPARHHACSLAIAAVGVSRSRRVCSALLFYNVKRF